MGMMDENEVARLQRAFDRKSLACDEWITIANDFRLANEQLVAENARLRGVNTLLMSPAQLREAASMAKAEAEKATREAARVVQVLKSYDAVVNALPMWIGIIVIRFGPRAYNGATHEELVTELAAAVGAARVQRTQEENAKIIAIRARVTEMQSERNNASAVGCAFCMGESDVCFRSIQDGACAGERATQEEQDLTFLLGCL